MTYQVHPSSIVDEPCKIGEGTKIWHFCHISKDSKIGRNCSLGQNVFIANAVEIGDNVKIQNNISIYSGTIVEDDVFLGPSCVLTNISNPRSQVIRKNLYEKTLLRRGSSVGANATVVCGTTIGRYSFVGAGTVVTKDVPDYALVVGVPGKQMGWMSRHGYRLEKQEKTLWKCPISGYRYEENDGVLKCLDLHEDSPLPESETQGTISYQDARQKRGES